MEQVALKECADVSYGRPPSRYERTEKASGPRRRKNAPEPVYELVRVMTVKALDSWPDSRDDLEQRELDVTRAESFARAGDVIVALSSPFPSALIGEDDVAELPLFIPNSCAIVRPDDKLESGYLAGYLDLDIVRDGVLPQQSGGGRAPMLTIDQLNELRIPLPPTEIQSALSSVSLAFSRLESARRRADRCDRNLVEAAYARAFGGDGR